MDAETKNSKDVVAHDFMVAAQGKLEQDKINAAVAALKSQTGKYPATGSVVSMVFYLQFQVNITGGKTFNGKAGGLSTPGAGALFGDVYTDDLDRLYRDTISFSFVGTPVYLNIIFFDGNSKVLGHAQFGAVSIVTGVGGGTGNWS